MVNYAPPECWILGFIGIRIHSGEREIEGHGAKEYFSCFSVAAGVVSQKLQQFFVTRETRANTYIENTYAHSLRMAGYKCECVCVFECVHTHLKHMLHMLLPLYCWPP